MLTYLRKNAKAQKGVMYLTILALASYVLVSFGSAPPKAQQDTIVELGSSKIKMRDAFIESADISGIFSQVSAEFRNQFTANRLIQTAILRDGADDLGISVSDAELADLVIQRRTTGDGDYIDAETWADYVQRRYQLRVNSYENYLRENALKSSKFSTLFLQGTYISEAEIKEQFVKNNQKVKLEMLTLNVDTIKDQIKMDTDDQVKAFWKKNPAEFVSGPLRQVRYIALSPNDFTDEIEITDEMVKNEYDTNLERYRLRENVRVREIHFNSNGKDRNDAETYQAAQKVAGEISDGMDFGVAADKYSEGRSKSTHINIYRGQRQKETEEAVFGMSDGDISPPLKVRNGYSLFHRDSYTAEKLRDLESVKTGIVSTIKRKQAREKARVKAEAFHKKIADGANFEGTAKVAGLEVKTSRFFDNDRFADMGPDLQKNPQINNGTFALEKLNDVASVIDTGRFHVVIQWAAESEGKPLDWEADQVRIKTAAGRVAAEQLIKKTLESVKAAALKDPSKELKEFQSLKDFLKLDHFITTPDFVDGSTLPIQLSKDLDFENDLFSLEAGQFLESMAGNNDSSFTLTRLTEKQSPDMSKYDEERFDIVASMRNAEGGLVLQSYIYAKQKQYDPKDIVRAKLMNSLGNSNR